MLRIFRYWRLFVLVALLIAARSSAIAQEATENAAPADPMSATTDQEDQEPASLRPRIIEAQPPLLYLLDEKGALQPVPGFSMKDFERLHDVQAARDQLRQPPSSSVQSLSVRATAREGRVELAVELVVTVNDAGWVPVPIRFDQAALVEPSRHEGPGEFFVEPAQQGGGLTVWIRDGQNEQHTVKISAAAPTEKLLGDERFRISLPPAASSTLHLTVPVANAAAVTSGASLMESNDVGGSTEFRFEGLKREFEVSWRESKGGDASPTPTLRANGTVLVKLDGYSVTSTATIDVRSSGQPFDHFHVRLPPHADLLRGDQAGYSFSFEPLMTTDQQAKIVEVRMDEPNTAATVRFVTERNITEPDQPLELAGFEVLETARQWGHIGVATNGEWRVLWKQQSLLRRIDDVPAALRAEDPVAVFEYFGQPCQLIGQIAQRETRLTVDPEYQVRVSADQLELTAKLKYRVRGPKVYSLALDMAGWELDENRLAPMDVIDFDDLVSSSGSPLIIPLKQPQADQFEIIVRARRPLSADLGWFSFELPRPAADTVGPAQLLIEPADNVELAPDSEATVGLSRQRVDSPSGAPFRRREPLIYRSSGVDGRFAAHVVVHTRTVEVDVISQVQLLRHGGRLEQRIVYRIEYVPTNTLLLSVPNDIADPRRLEITHEGERLSATPVSDGGNGDITQLRVVLPTARLGSVELGVAVALDEFSLPTEASVPLRVPLVMPANETIKRNEVSVVAGAGMNVALRGDAWKPNVTSPPAGDAQQGMRLVADGARSEVTVVARVEDRLSQNTTIVERAWLQTELTRTTRMERAVYRIASTDGRIEVRLPNHIPVEEIEARLDGAMIPISHDSKGTITLTWSDDGGERRERVVELLYRSPLNRAAWGWTTLEPPQVVGNVVVRRMYWQVVLPWNEHLIVAPSNLTHEFEWLWRSAYWSREPLHDHERLERWSGAIGDHEASPGNRYLFSSLDAKPEMRLFTATRSMIVLGASASALMVGLLLIYLPATQRATAIFVGSLSMIASGLVYPGIAVLFGQASALGFVLAVFAAIMENLIARRRRERVVLQGSSTAMIDGAGSDAGYPVPRLGSNSSTRTATPSASSSFGGMES